MENNFSQIQKRETSVDQCKQLLTENGILFRNLKNVLDDSKLRKALIVVAASVGIFLGSEISYGYGLDKNKGKDTTSEFKDRLDESITIPVSDNFPLITDDSIKFKLSYKATQNTTSDNELEVLNFGWDSVRISGYRDGEAVFEDDYRGVLIDWCDKNKKDNIADLTMQMSNEEILLYIRLAIYDGLVKNSKYLKESSLVALIIKSSIKQISQYGDMIDFDKIPEKLKE